MKSITEIIERIRTGSDWNESFKVLLVMTALTALTCASVTHDFAVSPALRAVHAGLVPYFPVIDNMAKASWNAEIVTAQAVIGVLGMVLMLAVLVLFGPRLRHTPEWNLNRLLIAVFLLFPFVVGLLYGLNHGSFESSHAHYLTRGDRLRMIFMTSRIGTSVVVAASAAVMAIMAKVLTMFPGKIVVTSIHLLRSSKNAK